MSDQRRSFVEMFQVLHSLEQSRRFFLANDSAGQFARAGRNPLRRERVLLAAARMVYSGCESTFRRLQGYPRTASCRERRLQVGSFRNLNSTREREESFVSEQLLTHLTSARFAVAQDEGHDPRDAVLSVFQ